MASMASKAVAAAGGLTRFADSAQVAIWKARDGWFVLFNLRDVLAKKSKAKDPVLEGGDVIVIKERIINS